MDTAYGRLLREQLGLLSVAQARSLGIDEAAIRRRVAGPRPRWRKVLPRVYATFLHPLTVQQQTIAAWLYAGSDAMITGAAALHGWGLRHLPREVKPLPVQILLPWGRECRGQAGLTVRRTRRPPLPALVNGLPTVSVTRAVGDCVRTLRTYETTLAVVAAALNGETTTVEQLAQELREGGMQGSKHLRRALREAASGARSVPEAQLLALVRRTSLPAPAVNEPIVVNGRRYVPDLRWGFFIVEVDSKLHHFLEPGSWEATQRRRARLRAAGYHVLPVTPESIRDEPDEVLRAIIAGHHAYAAG